MPLLVRPDLYPGAGPIAIKEKTETSQAEIKEPPAVVLSDKTSTQELAAR
jgi:hypothetical protein